MWSPVGVEAGTSNFTSVKASSWPLLSPFIWKKKDQKDFFYFVKVNVYLTWNSLRFFFLTNGQYIAAIIILIREILISGLREFLAKAQVSIQATKLAKFKTFVQMFSIAILLTGESGNKIINFGDYNAHSIGIILLWIAAFLTI